MLTITDHYGNIVLKESVAFPLSRQLDLGRQRPGIYMINVSVGEQQYSEKVVLN